MKRTHLLITIAVAGLALAMILPRVRRPIAPAPWKTVIPSTQSGSLTLRVRPARHAFLANGDNFDVVYELSAASVTLDD